MSRLLTCVDSSDCDDGTGCSGGYCLEGTIPAPECVAGLQLYSLHATDAFTAVGSVSGYLHPIIEGAGGQCVKDPAASPLLLGRVPLTAPPCTGDDVDDVLPNPCSVQVEHTVEVPVYSGLATCTRASTGGSTMRTGMVDAIRFRNPSMTLHLANPTYPGDAQCLADRAGTRVGIPVVAPGYAFRFSIAAGFTPQVARGMVGVFPTRIVRSPDGVLWIVEEGDLLPQVADTNTRGQIFRFDPDIFDGVVIR